MNDRNIYQRVAFVQGRIASVKKSGRNAFHKYDYITEADILSELRPLLVEAGLAITFQALERSVDKMPTVNSNGEIVGYKDAITSVKVVFAIVNIDNPTERIEILIWGDGQDGGDKGIYKAYTGARKYALREAFLIEADDDPEKDKQENSKGRTTAVTDSKRNPAPSALPAVELENESQDPSELERLLERIARMNKGDLLEFTGTGEEWKSKQRELIERFGHHGLATIKQRLAVCSALLKTATPTTPAPTTEDGNEPAARLKEALGETSPFDFLSLKEAERQIFATDDPELIHSVRQRVAKHAEKYNLKELAKANRLFDAQEKLIREAKGETAE